MTNGDASQVLLEVTRPAEEGSTNNKCVQRTSSSELLFEESTLTSGGMPPHSRMAAWFSIRSASSRRASMATAAASFGLADLPVVPSFEDDVLLAGEGNACEPVPEHPHDKYEKENSKLLHACPHPASRARSDQSNGLEIIKSCTPVSFSALLTIRSFLPLSGLIGSSVAAAKSMHTEDLCCQDVAHVTKECRKRGTTYAFQPTKSSTPERRKATSSHLSHARGARGAQAPRSRVAFGIVRARAPAQARRPSQPRIPESGLPAVRMMV